MKTSEVIADMEQIYVEAKKEGSTQTMIHACIAIGLIRISKEIPNWTDAFKSIEWK